MVDGRLIQYKDMEIDLRLLLLAIPILAFSIGFHEMMHALVSDALGDDTARRMGRVSLNPFRHIDPIMTVGLPLILLLFGLPPFGAARPVPFNPLRIRHAEFGVALVALAGPLANLVLAIVAGLLYRLTGVASGIFLDILSLLLSINVGFFVFNLIPFPPLDGSRVLYAFAPESIQRFMIQIESLGIISLFIFMFVIFPFLSPIFSFVSDSLLRALT